MFCQSYWRNEEQQKHGIVFLNQITTRTPTRLEAVILRDLLENQTCSYERLKDQLWPINRIEDPPLFMESEIRVFISRVKAKLNPEWRIIKMRDKEYALVHVKEVRSDDLGTPVPELARTDSSGA